MLSTALVSGFYEHGDVLGVERGREVALEELAAVCERRGIDVYNKDYDHPQRVLFWTEKKAVQVYQNATVDNINSMIDIFAL